MRKFVHVFKSFWAFMALSIAIASVKVEALLSPTKQKMLKSRFGQSQIGALNIEFLFGILFFLLLAAQLVPQIVTSIIGVDTSSWSTVDSTMWGLITTVVVLGIVYVVAKKMGIIGGSD